MKTASALYKEHFTKAEEELDFVAQGNDAFNTHLKRAHVHAMLAVAAATKMSGQNVQGPEIKR